MSNPEYNRTIHGHKVQYHITRDDAGRTITIAKIHENCKLDVFYDFQDKTHMDILWGHEAKLFGRMYMAAHPVARAVCDPNDDYDEEYGKTLAHRRLEVGYWSMYEDRLGKLNDILMGWFDANSKYMTIISEKHLQRED